MLEQIQSRSDLLKLTPEEDLLYAETMLRIDKKLLEAAN
jgi:hypothetical protein